MWKLGYFSPTLAPHLLNAAPGSIKSLTLLSWLVGCEDASVQGKILRQRDTGAWGGQKSGHRGTGHCSCRWIQKWAKGIWSGYQLPLLQVTFPYHQRVDKSRKIQMIFKFCQHFLNKSLPFYQRLKDAKPKCVSYVFYQTKWMPYHHRGHVQNI